jgi:hypothetical protein
LTRSVFVMISLILYISKYWKFDIGIYVTNKDVNVIGLFNGYFCDLNDTYTKSEYQGGSIFKIMCKGRKNCLSLFFVFVLCKSGFSKQPISI